MGEAWRKKDCIVDNIFHIPGPENPSDFYIRGEGERALSFSTEQVFFVSSDFASS